MTDLIFLQAEFWDFRQMMRLYWAIPDTQDAARFAVTEAAEVLKTNGLWEAFVTFAATRQAQIAAADALDAALRRNVSYSRNTARNMDERNELGDLAMMLLTAIGEKPLTVEEMTTIDAWKSSFGKNDLTILDDIVHMTNCVHQAAYRWHEQDDVRNYAAFTLALIDRYPGMDLTTVLRSRMERIYRKHHPDAGRTFPVTEGEAYQNETPATYTTLAGGII